VEISKGFHRKRPQTLCRITGSGRTRFVAYLNELEQVVKDAMAVKRAQPVERPGRSPLAPQSA